MLLRMMAVLEDIFPLNLCTSSTCHSADTSACISTTNWMQQSGVYRRQKASRLIVVSGELVALSSLAQHCCRSTGHAIASPCRWSKTGHTVLRSWYRYATRWLDSSGQSPAPTEQPEESVEQWAQRWTKVCADKRGTCDVCGQGPLCRPVGTHSRSPSRRTGRS